MSFILDALRKSEERRQGDNRRTGGRRVLGFPGTPRTARAFPLVWLLLLLLPAALFIGWWLGRSPSAETPSSASQMHPEIASPAAPEQPPAQGATGQGAPASVQSAPTPARKRPEPVVAPVPAQPKAPAETVSRQPRAASAGSLKSGADSAAEPLVIEYSELSAAQRARLPELEMSLHFYSSDPARRIVRLNGQLLHEGERLAEGPRLQEITETAAVLSDGDITFRINSRK